MLAFQLRISGGTPAIKRCAETHRKLGVNRGQEEVRCVPTCVGPDNPARYEPVLAETYVRTLLEQSYRTGRPGVAQQTVAERLKPL